MPAATFALLRPDHKVGRLIRTGQRQSGRRLQVAPQGGSALLPDPQGRFRGGPGRGGHQGLPVTGAPPP
ncbi:MAG: hypothetical protein ACK55I_47260, partial [bacterium]